MRTSTLALSCLVLEALRAVGAIDNNMDMERIFKERTREDWEDAWHQETHARCRETLLRHLYWACEKDIYRVTRRSSSSSPWLPGWRARGMLRYRRDLKKRNASPSSSITQECCAGAGCTWEEYAEYCPTNKRINRFL